VANADSNTIIRSYLVAQTTLTDVVSTRIYCPRLPEGESLTLPSISFFTRGGGAAYSAYIPGIVEPSVQFDCWATDIAGGLTGPREARRVYRALYDVLQGIQREVVTVDGTDYIIWSAIEEVQGMDLVDSEIPNYFRVLTFFKFMIKAE